MINFPTPPQCLVMSPIRWAGIPLMKTVMLPISAFHMFASQQGACIPGSPTRKAGNPFTMTSGDPWIPGPTTGCGQARQPWASALAFARSLTRPCGGISSPCGASTPHHRYESAFRALIMWDRNSVHRRA